jgi:hypothetical protein
VIVKLSLGEIERARLVLRGGSIIYWRRLDVASIEECDTILCDNGFDPQGEQDAACHYDIRIPCLDGLSGEHDRL